VAEEMFRRKLLSLLLGSVFLIGLLPISNHMSSMQTMQMDAGVSLNSTAHEKTSDNSTGSCCDAIGSFLLACDFMVFQSAAAGSNRGSQQIAYSVPVIQSIYLETLAPPPKA
jgi:hypothetical protein